MGFAGLMGMVVDLDVNSIVAKANTLSVGNENISNKPVKVDSPMFGEVGIDEKMTNAQKIPKPTPRSSLFKIFGYLIAVVCIIGIMYAATLSDNKPSYPSANPTPTYPKPPEPSPIISPSVVSESIPPVGAGQTLNASQIAYCLAEKIRLEVGQETVNKYDHSAIKNFNMLVDDYNSRCSSFRYMETDMQAAQLYIAAHRLDIQQEGRARFIKKVKKKLTNY